MLPAQQSGGRQGPPLCCGLLFWAMIFLQYGVDVVFRTKLVDRKLPGYTKGEELFNMVSHIVGGGLGVVAFLTCIIVAAYHQNVWGIVSGKKYVKCLHVRLSFVLCH